jgi:hypothetical protein
MGKDPFTTYNISLDTGLILVIVAAVISKVFIVLAGIDIPCKGLLPETPIKVPSVFKAIPNSE